MEIKPGNASQIGNEFGQVNVNPSLAVNSLSGLNTYQSLEHKDDFVDANEDASDFVEDSSGCGLGFVEYRHVSPSFSPENCEAKLPVCKKYPECPICTIHNEQRLVQRVSDEVLTHFSSAFYYELLEFSSLVRCDRSSKQISSSR